MRKSFTVFAAILFCAAATTSLTACGGSDDDSNSPAKPTTAVLDLSLWQTTDMLENCDISIEYKDEIGEKIVKVTDTTWTKKFTKNLPDTVIVKKFVTIKADKELASVDSFINTTLKYAYGYSLLDATGKAITTIPTVYGRDNILRHREVQVARAITNGYFNQTLTLVFGTDGKLQVKEELESNKMKE